MKNKIIIIAGDPNSVNSEIIFKAWKKSSNKIKNKIVIIGSHSLLKDQAKKLKINIKLSVIEDIDKNPTSGIQILDQKLNYKNCFKVRKKFASRYILECLNLAHKLASLKKIKGFINCPIDKKLIKGNGTLGVTEFLAKKSNISKYSEVMLLYNKKLSVVPLTTHIKIKDISKKIKKSLIMKKTKTLNYFYQKFFKKKPKIALLGLNPHNSELNKNSEEVKEIIPAVKLLKKNLYISGPIPADSFFIKDYQKYDVVIGMYHDQVLIPFKSFFKFDAINLTLGLKYLRISPDHGTAKDIILKNKADITSLKSCIRFLNNI